MSMKTHTESAEAGLDIMLEINKQKMAYEWHSNYTSVLTVLQDRSLKLFHLRKEGDDPSFDLFLSGLPGRFSGSPSFLAKAALRLAI